LYFPWDKRKKLKRKSHLKVQNFPQFLILVLFYSIPTLVLEDCLRYVLVHFHWTCDFLPIHCVNYSERLYLTQITGSNCSLIDYLVFLNFLFLIVRSVFANRFIIMHHLKMLLTILLSLQVHYYRSLNIPSKTN